MTRALSYGITLFTLLILIGAAGTGFFHFGNEPDTSNLDNTVEDTSGITPGESFWWEMKQTEKNHLGLVQKEPPLQMDNSLERENLKRRYTLLNDRDKMFYVYLLSHGNFVGYFTAQGKVSSVNSKLTNPEQVFEIPRCRDHNTGNNCYPVTASPQMDGSYGTNGDAVFFFTTDGRYVEWNGQYLISDYQLPNIQPIKFTKSVE